MLTNDLAFAADPISLRREETRFPSQFLASPSDATDLEAECLCCSRQARKSQVTAALAAVPCFTAHRRIRPSPLRRDLTSNLRAWRWSQST